MIFMERPDLRAPNLSLLYCEKDDCKARVSCVLRANYSNETLHLSSLEDRVLTRGVILPPSFID